MSGMPAVKMKHERGKFDYSVGLTVLLLESEQIRKLPLDHSHLKKPIQTNSYIKNIYVTEMTIQNLQLGTPSFK